MLYVLQIFPHAQPDGTAVIILTAFHFSVAILSPNVLDGPLCPSGPLLTDSFDHARSARRFIVLLEVFTVGVPDMNALNVVTSASFLTDTDWVLVIPIHVPFILIQVCQQQRKQ